MENECAENLRSLMDRLYFGNYELSHYERGNILHCLKDANNTKMLQLLEDPALLDITSSCILNGQLVSIRNQCFLYELIALLIQNEQQFLKLQSMEATFIKIQSMLNEILVSENCSQVLYSAWFNVLRNCLRHRQGVMYVMTSDIWKNVLQIHNVNRPRLAHTSYEFIAALVWKLAVLEFDKDLNTVTNYLLQPIMNNVFTENEVFDIEEDESNSKAVIMPLSVVYLIINDTERFVNDKTMRDTMHRMASYNYAYRRIFTGSRDPELLTLVKKIAFKLYISTSIVRCSNEGQPSNGFLPNVLALFQNIMTITVTSKRLLTSTIEICYELYKTWVKTNYPATFQRNGIEFDIETQFLLILTMPMMLCSYNHLAQSQESSITELYGEQSANLMTEQTMNCFYKLRELICADNAVRNSCIIKNLKYILKLRPIVKAKHAGILFQNLYSVLALYFPFEEDNALVIREGQLTCSESVKILSLTVEALRLLLMEHTIHWYEVLDIVNLPANLMNLINTNILPAKQMLQVMDLLNVAVQKSLSPDMTLLIESKQDSTLSRMAVAMKSYISHTDWEVRDSALTIVLTCTKLAFVSYTPLQKLLTENQLIQLALNKALFDENNYVQCTALKCLKAASKVDCLWKEILKLDANIYTKLLYMLHCNSEEMVQIETAKVLTSAFMNQKHGQNFEKDIYNSMAALSIDESKWELQLAGLNFWENVIQFKLTSIGMLDGTFPMYTFSKSKRKIIKLNSEEIKKQLLFFMEELCSIRCLTVLDYCTKNSNVEVFKKAYKISSDIVKILTDHNCEIENTNKNNIDTKSKPIEPSTFLQSAKIDNEENGKENTNKLIEKMEETLDLDEKHSDKYRSQVIDEIINSSLHELISNLPIQTPCSYETNLILNNMLLNQISPAEFVNSYLCIDYSMVVENLNCVSCKLSLNELLNDMLLK